MTPWVEATASNIVLASVLAVVAAALAKWSRRPALVHVLCVLALLKLVTPPVWSVPVLPAEATPQRTALPPAAILAMQAAPRAERAPTLRAAAPVASKPNPATFALPDAGTLLLFVWGAGSAAVLLSSLLRGWRFSRTVLRAARPASPGLQAEVRQLAELMGLARPPEIAVVSSRISPMIWPALHRPRLVLPASLLRQLRPDERAALLAHELAHVRRRDYWVRRLELLAGVAFWWLPTLWWLRHCLRDAEEKCCDAWVVWALPEKERAYADALLSTVDYLSESRLALPPQASGAGHVHQLKQRLTMIMEATTPRSMGTLGRLAIVGLAVLFLPVLPTRAQEKERSESESLRQAHERIEKLERLIKKVARNQERTEEKAEQRELELDDLDEHIKRSVEQAMEASRSALEQLEELDVPEIDRSVLEALQKARVDAPKYSEAMRDAMEALKNAQTWHYTDSTNEVLDALRSHDLRKYAVELDDLPDSIADQVRQQLKAAQLYTQLDGSEYQDAIKQWHTALEMSEDWGDWEEMSAEDWEDWAETYAEDWADWAETFADQDWADVYDDADREEWKELRQRWADKGIYWRGVRDDDEDEEDDAEDREDRIEEIQDEIADLQEHLAALQRELKKLQRQDV